MPTADETIEQIACWLEDTIAAAFGTLASYVGQSDPDAAGIAPELIAKNAAEAESYERLCLFLAQRIRAREFVTSPPR